MESNTRQSRLSRIPAVKRSLYPEKRSLSSDCFRRDSQITGMYPGRSTTPVQQTPMTNRKSSFGAGLLMTSERKRAPPTEDKKMLQVYINRITSYIKYIRDLGADFIAKGGLRAMTVREFVIIINYIVKQLHPKANFTHNYSDELFAYLSKLEYPYSVNKSWFKTPNAPHSFNHIIIMLNFLLDFLPLDENEDDGEMAFDSHEFNTVEQTVKNPDFPDAEFTNAFNRTVMIGYNLWANCQENEFAELKQNVENDLIRATTKSFKNKAELDEKIATIERSFEVLLTSRVNKPDENEYNSLRMKVEERQQEVNNLTELVSVTNTKNDKLERELQDLNKELNKLIAEEQRYESIIDRQERDRLQEKYEAMKHEFAQLDIQVGAKQSLMDQLNEAYYNKMMKNTRLVDEKIKLHNSLLIKLLELKEVDDLRDALGLECVDSNHAFSMGELEALKMNLSKLGSTVLRQNQGEIDALAAKLNDLKGMKIAYQESTKATLDAKIQDLQRDYKVAQAQIVEKTVAEESRFAELKDNEQELREQVGQLRREEEKRQRELAQLEEEKDELIQRTFKQMDRIASEKEKNLESLKNIVSQLLQSIQEP